MESILIKVVVGAIFFFIAANATSTPSIHQFLDSIDARILAQNTSSTTSHHTKTKKLPSIQKAITHTHTTSITSTMPSIKEAVRHNRTATLTRKKSRKNSLSIPKPSPPPKPPKKIGFNMVLIQNGTPYLLTPQGMVLKEGELYEGCYIARVTLIRVLLRCKNGTKTIPIGQP